jgi:hypothetical protein
MSESSAAAAPESGDIPTFDALAADREIAALLEFEPVPRKVRRPDGWTPDLQRRFIALLAALGTPQRAAAAMRKRVSGIEIVYGDDEKGEFRASWEAAVALAAGASSRELAPGLDRPRRHTGASPRPRNRSPAKC